MQAQQMPSHSQSFLRAQMLEDGLWPSSSHLRDPVASFHKECQGLASVTALQDTTREDEAWQIRF